MRLKIKDNQKKSKKNKRNKILMIKNKFKNNLKNKKKIKKQKKNYQIKATQMVMQKKLSHRLMMLVL